MAESMPNSATDLPPAPLRFERRLCDRWPVEGVAVAFETGGDGFGSRHALRLIDESDGGLGVFADDPLSPGTAVTVSPSQPGHPLRHGVVKRCLPCGSGYRVGIVFRACPRRLTTRPRPNRGSPGRRTDAPPGRLSFSERVRAGRAGPCVR